MNCRDMRTFIHALEDGELDLGQSAAAESHLRECADCARMHAQFRTLKSVLAEGGMPAYRSPAGLRPRIRRSLRQALRAEQPVRIPGWSWMPIACAAAVALVVGWGSFRYFSSEARSQQLVQVVVAGHARSLMVDHLEDIASTDRHTVKPWFNGKLDFSPWVEDLASDGFPLAGGRLDYLADRPVAALVFERRKHVINLFLWPSTGEANVPLRESKYHGYQLFDWTMGGMTFWAVSDLNRIELREFVDTVQRHVATAGSP